MVCWIGLLASLVLLLVALLLALWPSVRDLALAFVMAAALVALLGEARLRWPRMKR